MIKNTAMVPLRRVMHSCEARASLTREKPDLRLLPSQAVMRSNFLSRSARNAEMSAVRALIGSLRQGGPDENREIILAEFPWVRSPSVKLLVDAIALAEITPRDHMARAVADMKAIIASGLSRFHEGLSIEEAMRQISGVRKESAVKTVNRKGQSILWKDYLSIMMDLAHFPAKTAMNDLISHGDFSPGVARVLIGTMYFTGIRPIEAWGLDLMVPKSDLVISEIGRDTIRNSPAKAVLSGMMRPVSEESALTGLSMAQACRNACELAAAPAILMIRNAKQENANRHLRCPYRYLILENMDERDLDILCHATLFSHGDTSDLGRRRAIESSNTVLRNVLSRHPSIRSDITPYTFRHSFATRMRSLYPDHVCAAMTGHTAIRTFKGYGEKRGSGSSSGGWRPKPDPERVQMIEAVWSGHVPEAEMLEAAHSDIEIIEMPATPDAKLALPSENGIRIAIRVTTNPEPSLDLPSPSPWQNT